MKTESLTKIRVLFAYYFEPRDDLIMAGELLQGFGAHPGMKLKLKEGEGSWRVTGICHLPPEVIMAEPHRIGLGLHNSDNPQQSLEAGQHLIEVRD